MNKSLHAALVKIYTSGGNPLSHSCDDSVVVKKVFPDYIVGVVGQSSRS
jgi:hypothetical protein